MYLAESALTPLVMGQHEGSVPRSVDEPIPTLTRGCFTRLIEPFLVKVHGSLTKHETPKSRVRSVDKPYLTITTKRHGTYLAQPVARILKRGGKIPAGASGILVRIDGVSYLLDIRVRQVRLEELLQFQGLSADYVLVGTKTDRTAQIGNAVSEKMAHALGRAALLAMGHREDVDDDEAAA
jgi:hypothetical protein